jgi:hypothetical protein
MSRRTIRVGCAGGYLEGRLEPGLLIAAKGRCDYLGLEALNEASLSVLQRAMEADPSVGFHARGVQSIVALVGGMGKRPARIASSVDGANPVAGAQALHATLRNAGTPRKIAFVHGDNLTGRLSDLVKRGKVTSMDGVKLRPADLDGVFAASAYLGGSDIATGSAWARIS